MVTEQTVFMPELADQHDRVQSLQDNAFKTDESGYYRPLTEVEIENRRITYFDNDGKIQELTDKKKELVREITEELKVIKSENALLRREINEKAVKEDGLIYMVANLEAGMMETYDKEGVLVSSRRLNPSERNEAKQRINFPVNNSKLFIPNGTNG